MACAWLFLWAGTVATSWSSAAFDDVSSSDLDAASAGAKVAMGSTSADAIPKARNGTVCMMTPPRRVAAVAAAASIQS
jgi:hypothetical protein